jgi:hypothetical protein
MAEHESLEHSVRVRDLPLTSVIIIGHLTVNVKMGVISSFTCTHILSVPVRRTFIITRVTRVSRVTRVLEDGLVRAANGGPQPALYTTGLSVHGCNSDASARSLEDQFVTLRDLKGVVSFLGVIMTVEEYAVHRLPSKELVHCGRSRVE